MESNNNKVFNINKRKRLIQSNKFKEHMKNHIEDFIQPYDKLVIEAENILSNKGLMITLLKQLLLF